MQAQSNLSYKPNHVFSGTACCLLGASCALLAAIACLSAKNWSGLFHVSAIWGTMAKDFLDGVLYRPQLGPLGFGGTRYMPGFIVLNGAFQLLGFDFYAAGVASSLTGVLSLAAGVALFCRRVGLSCAQVVCAVSCIFGWTLLSAMVQVRADILTAGLTALGLAVIIGKERLDLRDLVLASLLFALAWATKLTAIHGPAAVFLYLVLAGRKSVAFRFTVAAALVLLAVGVLSWIWSDGRVLQILGPAASSGTDVDSVVKAPFRFVNMLKSDGPGFLLFFAACIVLATDWRQTARSLPGIHFILVTLSTLVILCSPGTAENHMVELQASALCFLAFYGIRHLGNAAFFSYSVILLAVFQIFSASIYLYKDVYPVGSKKKYAQIVSYFGRDTEVLSENPSVPLALGSHVVIQDPFMLRVMSDSNPEIEQAIRTMISSKKYEHIVLSHDLTKLGPGHEYPDRHLGAAFVESMRSNYKYLEKVGGFHVYVPTR